MAVRIARLLVACITAFVPILAPSVAGAHGAEINDAKGDVDGPPFVHDLAKVGFSHDRRGVRGFWRTHDELKDSILADGGYLFMDIESNHIPGYYFEATFADGSLVLNVFKFKGDDDGIHIGHGSIQRVNEHEIRFSVPARLLKQLPKATDLKSWAFSSSRECHTDDYGELECSRGGDDTRWIIKHK